MNSQIGTQSESGEAETDGESAEVRQRPETSEIGSQTDAENQEAGPAGEPHLRETKVRPEIPRSNPQRAATRKDGDGDDNRKALNPRAPTFTPARKILKPATVPANNNNNSNNKPENSRNTSHLPPKETKPAEPIEVEDDGHFKGKFSNNQMRYPLKPREPTTGRVKVDSLGKSENTDGNKHQSSKVGIGELVSD